MTDLVVEVDLEKLYIRILEQSDRMYAINGTEDDRDNETSWIVDSVDCPEIDEDYKAFYIRGRSIKYDDNVLEVSSIIVLKQIIKTLDNLNKRGYKVVINCRTEL